MSCVAVSESPDLEGGVFDALVTPEPCVTDQDSAQASAAAAVGRAELDFRIGFFKFGYCTEYLR